MMGPERTVKDAISSDERDDGGGQQSAGEHTRKRRLPGVDPANIIDLPRDRKRKREQGEEEEHQDGKKQAGDAKVKEREREREKEAEVEKAAAVKIATRGHGKREHSEEGETGEDAADLAQVQADGLKLHEVLRNYQRDGRYISTDFIRLPSKRQYPDYYQIIKKPIAFEEIKTRLDNLEYPSLDAVFADFKQMFVNAKRYNMKDSSIFLDAKRLHKLLRLEYGKITGETKPDEEEEEEEEAMKKKQRRVPKEPKEKAPTFKGWLQSKLTALVEHKDATGRPYSEFFTTLPDREENELYYRVIGHPMAFDTVQEKIRKRHYPNIPAFKNDVSLIFSNAMFYNEENSRVWKDAKTLELHFAEIMKEPPPEFPTRARKEDGAGGPGTAPKIKLKVGGVNNEGVNPSPEPEQHPTGLKLRLGPRPAVDLVMDTPSPMQTSDEDNEQYDYDIPLGDGSGQSPFPMNDFPRNRSQSRSMTPAVGADPTIRLPPPPSHPSPFAHTVALPPSASPKLPTPALSPPLNQPPSLSTATLAPPAPMASQPTVQGKPDLSPLQAYLTQAVRSSPAPSTPSLPVPQPTAGPAAPSTSTSALPTLAPAAPHPGMPTSLQPAQPMSQPAPMMPQAVATPLPAPKTEPQIRDVTMADATVPKRAVERQIAKLNLGGKQPVRVTTVPDMREFVLQHGIVRQNSLTLGHAVEAIQVFPISTRSPPSPRRSPPTRKGKGQVEGAEAAGMDEDAGDLAKRIRVVSRPLPIAEEATSQGENRRWRLNLRTGVNVVEMFLSNTGQGGTSDEELYRLFITRQRT